LHDAVSSERVGTPALGVMTNRFVSAAELMAKVLGAPDYKFAVIDHPVSSASDTELANKAERAVELIDELILCP
tara:strand:+ start:720 stop:941 length:222 start_codon:yes stop_codon:yes gene_type:complete